MSWTHIHLLLNHVPVIGILIALALLAWGLARGSQDNVRASMVLLALLAVVTVVVYFTGEPTEELVEHLPGVSEPMIEAHEDSAKLATLAFAVLGIVALGGLVAYRRRALPTRFGSILLVLVLATAGTLAWTANLGGQIRHSEIRADSGPASSIGRAGREPNDH